MPISAAGQQKSFADLQTEFGGSHPITMGEYAAYRVSGSGNTIDMDDFAGATAASFPASGSAWFQVSTGLGTTDAPEMLWGDANHSSASTSQVGCNLGFQNDTTNTRIALRSTTYTSSAASSYTYNYVSYSGYSGTTFRAKCVYATTAGGTNFSGSVENPASYSPASNTFANVSTSNYSPIWQWTATCSSGSGTKTITSSTHPYWTVQAGTSGDSLSGPTYGSTTGNSISLSANRGTQGPPGFGGDICIHEDMKISTQLGDLTIDELVDKSTKVWGWNKDTNQSELTDVLEIKIVEHDTLYKINNIMATDDHILYAEGHTAVSVNPTKAKTNYDKDSTEIKVGDKLMKKDGTLETVSSIAAYSGTHRTYTVKTVLGNFYADEILVDSEI